MKILHGIASLHPRDGGPARSVPALASAVASTGAKVVVCSREPASIDLTPFASVTFRDGSVDEVAREFQPDVIHDHGIWLPSNHKAVRSAHALGAPVVISPRGMLEPWCLQHHPWRKRVAWYVYQARDLRKAAMLHATSSAEAENFRKLGFSQPVAVLPNGIRIPDKMAPSPRSDQFRLVYVSRIHPVKGLAELLEAWSNVRPANWRFDLYGPSEEGYDRVVRQIINDKNLSDSVALHDAVDDAEKWQLLSAADAAVLSSHSENFGIVVAEALAAGTPALTTTGTPWAGVVDKKCGWFVPPNALGLAEGLTALTSTDRSTLQEMGRRGREWMQVEFLWDSIGRRMNAAYEWMLDGQSNSAKPDFVI